MAWLIGILTRIALYARSTPYGGPFVTHWDRYFFHALMYNFMGTFVVSLPFFVLWFYRYDRATPRKRWTTIHWIQVAILMLGIVLDHVDAEVMRFVGVHLTPTLFELYDNRTGGLSLMLHSFASDAGGPFVPVLIVLFLPAFFLWTCAQMIAKLSGSLREWSKQISLSIVAVPVVVVCVFTFTPGGKFRMHRTQPFMMTLFQELNIEAEVGKYPQDYTRLVEEYRNDWLKASTDNDWSFPNQEYPLYRVPKTKTIPDETKRYNIIYLQLETLRAWESKLFRAEAEPEALPRLKALATGPKGAYWRRFLSFGPPTVNGFIGAHCGITPHSRFPITKRFSYTELYCLPQMLREHGYRTEYFTGSDPDWDGQRVWLERWYDKNTFYRDADEVDRVVFDRAAERIREMGRSGPFMATVVSITNHYPFRSREPSADIVTSEVVRERIKNTTHYTDLVVHDFIESLRDEPWFPRTLFVIVGDHGYNFGEHDGTPGNRNGYHESTWVPFVMYGENIDFPKGGFDTPAAMMDIAPTLAEVLGFRIPNPWQGHNLFHLKPTRNFCISCGRQVFGEGAEYSFVRDSNDGSLKLYHADDLEQKTPIQSPQLMQELLACVRDRSQLFDYSIETSTLWSSSLLKD